MPFDKVPALVDDDVDAVPVKLLVVATVVPLPEGVPAGLALLVDPVAPAVAVPELLAIAFPLAVMMTG